MAQLFCGINTPPPLTLIPSANPEMPSYDDDYDDDYGKGSGKGYGAGLFLKPQGGGGGGIWDPPQVGGSQPVSQNHLCYILPQIFIFILSIFLPPYPSFDLDWTKMARWGVRTASPSS